MRDEHIYLFLGLSLWRNVASDLGERESVKAFDSAPVVITGVVTVQIELLTPVAATKESLWGGNPLKPVLAKIKKSATVQ